MLEAIEAAMRGADPEGGMRPRPWLARPGRRNGDYPVSDLAAASVLAAVSAVQALCAQEFGELPEAHVDGALLDDWCLGSVRPVGWSLPAKWDPYSADFQTRDGWIRLHANAPHHRAAALAVLGIPGSGQAAAAAAREWQAGALEEAIVAAGGCAAELRAPEAWACHPQGQAVAAEPIVHWSDHGEAQGGWVPVSEARPLTGLRVLDLTRVLAGPAATRFLASFGADVLRIDPPHWREDGNAIEMSVGKTCAGLDLRRDADRAALARLAASADLLIHGYRADALDGLGFAPAMLRAANPKLISVGLNAYGWLGPWRNRRGFDSLVQRSSGLAALQAGRVEALPYQVLDYATGYLMAAAALEALRVRRSLGRVLSARLSLARQARLLADHRGARDLLAPYCGAFGAAAPVPEETDWGPAERLPLPYQVAGLAPGWRRGAHRLQSDAAAWGDAGAPG